MPVLLKWLWRIGILGVAAIWLYLLITFLFPDNNSGHDNGIENDRVSGKIINLKAITIGTPPEEGMDTLYQELDKLTIPELGCTLRFDFIPWGDERKQINIATASGEYDLIPGGVFSDYLTLVSKNAFLDLNPYLKLVPDLVQHYDSVQPDALKQCEINGALYGLPQYSNMGIANTGSGFFYREDLREKWNLEPITDINTMEAYLYRAKKEQKYKDEPLITDNRIWMALWDLLTKGKYLEISSALETPFVVVEADNPTKPVSRIETPEFQEILSYIAKWYRDGIIASDMLVASDNEGTKGLNLMLADKKPCETNVPIWSCSSNYIMELYKAHPDWKFGFFDYRLDSARLYLGSLTKNSVLSISSKTNSPEIAIKLLEKLHTDKRYYDLLCYGVEGIHYEQDQEVISYDTISVDNYYAGWTAAVDEDLNYKKLSVNPLWQKEVLDVYDRKQLIKQTTAEVNPLVNFTLKTTPVLQEINKLETVKKEAFQPMVCGVTADYEEGLVKLRRELKKAGFDDYLARIQKQLEEYSGK